VTGVFNLFSPLTLVLFLPYEDLHFGKHILSDAFSFLHHPVHASTVLHGPAPLTGSNTTRQNDFICTHVKDLCTLGLILNKLSACVFHAIFFLLLLVFGNYTNNIMSILYYFAY